MGLHGLLRLIFPDICPICRETAPENGQRVCRPCFQKLPIIYGETCAGCGAPLITDYAQCLECANNPRRWQRGISALRFEGAARECIHRFKYHGDVALVPVLTDLAHTALTQHQLAEEIDCLCPVPLHWFRQLRRGYNQAEMLCQGIAKQGTIPLERLLVRKRWTSQQASLSRSKRKQNLRSAFQIQKRAAVEGKRVLLVDDVMTTGATLDECTRILLKAGAKTVDVLTIARK